MACFALKVEQDDIISCFFDIPMWTIFFFSRPGRAAGFEAFQDGYPDRPRADSHPDSRRAARRSLGAVDWLGGAAARLPGLVCRALCEPLGPLRQAQGAPSCSGVGSDGVGTVALMRQSCCTPHARRLSRYITNHQSGQGDVQLHTI